MTGGAFPFPTGDVLLVQEVATSGQDIVKVYIVCEKEIERGAVGAV